MKTAIYIDDGVVQLVITPQSDFEKNALRSFEDGELNAKTFNGAFYDCSGGWTRQRECLSMNHQDQQDRSLILRVEK